MHFITLNYDIDLFIYSYQGWNARLKIPTLSGNISFTIMEINYKYIHRINYIIYFLFHYLCDNKFRKLRQIKIASPVETINHIISNKVSVSRFGDGEIGLMSGNNTD